MRDTGAQGDSIEMKIARYECHLAAKRKRPAAKRQRHLQLLKETGEESTSSSNNSSREGSE